MTRARDELYVCGYKIYRESPENSWYSLVDEAVQSQDILRAVELADGNSCWRYGPDPTWNGMASVLPKAAQEAPAWLFKNPDIAFIKGWATCAGYTP